MRDTPLTSQWRVWPALSSVPTGPASTMASVKLVPRLTDELASVMDTVGVGFTSVLDDHCIFDM